MTILRKLTNAALDLLFPPKCAGCGREGAYLCDTCQPTLTRLERPYCDICAAPGSAKICSWCKAVPPDFDRVRSPYLHKGTMRDMIQNLKYKNLRASAPTLGLLMHTYFESSRLAADLIVPGPLHPSRERERGYNQSELLAKEFSRLTSIPLATDLLRRTIDTEPQVAMDDYEKRRSNIAGAFECIGNPSGLNVLLVDDVITAGSTMSACAAPLKAKGAAKVWGLALAR